MVYVYYENMQKTIFVILLFLLKGTKGRHFLKIFFYKSIIGNIYEYAILYYVT